MLSIRDVMRVALFQQGWKLMNLNSFAMTIQGREGKEKKKRKDGYNFKVCGTIGYPFPLFPEDACGAVCHGAPQRATHQSRQQGVIIIFFLINDSTTKYDRIRW